MFAIRAVPDSLGDCPRRRCARRRAYRHRLTALCRGLLCWSSAHLGVSGRCQGLSSSPLALSLFSRRRYCCQVYFIHLNRICMEFCPLVHRFLRRMCHSTRSIFTECPSLNWWVSRASFAALSASHCSADMSAGGCSSSTTSVNPQPPQVTRNRAMPHTLMAIPPYLTVR